MAQIPIRMSFTIVREHSAVDAFRGAPNFSATGRSTSHAAAVTYRKFGRTNRQNGLHTAINDARPYVISATFAMHPHQTASITHTAWRDESQSARYFQCLFQIMLVDSRG